MLQVVLYLYLVYSERTLWNIVHLLENDSREWMCAEE
jgi:hypothetical protein